MNIYEELIEKAIKYRENSYCPYSNFAVGAALLTKSGKVYGGANVENCSYSATVCAERSAFFSAVSNGEREFDAIAIVGGAKGKPAQKCFPCAVCRQVMSELTSADFKVVLLSDKEGEPYSVYTLGELLPYSFELNDFVKSEINTEE